MSIAVPFFRCENFVETFAEINLGFRVTPTSVKGFRTESHYVIARMIIVARETCVKTRTVRKLEKLSARKQAFETFEKPRTDERLSPLLCCTRFTD